MSQTEHVPSFAARVWDPATGLLPLFRPRGGPQGSVGCDLEPLQV